MFSSFNGQTKDTEICASYRNELTIDRERVTELLNKDIENKTAALKEAEHKKKFFENNFKKYFNE